MMILRTDRTSRRSREGLAKWQTALLVLGLVALGFSIPRLWKSAGSGRVDYPYWCKDCQAVFDKSELGRDGWKRAPGAPSDSVVVCLRCNQGAAYPAVPCYECDAVHVLYLWKDNECPKCHPEIATAAAEEGIDLMPKKLQ